MRRVEFVLAVSLAVVASVMGATAQSDSLGDYARAVRKEKRPAAKKIYTNDNLPTSASISVVGAPQAAAEDEPAATAHDSKQKPDKVQKEEKTSEAKQPQDEAEWREQIDAQKKEIGNLEHELDLLKREYNLQVADYYGNAGNQLLDPKKWLDQEQKYRSDIADKQKQIEDAKSQLQDMEEAARKAGMPSSVSE
jgi:predicted RNase H-like nuclease (RuvC/YqgF family)